MRTVPDADDWMTLLTPLLNGHNTLRELTRPFPHQHRRFAEKLIALLVDLGLVQQIAADDMHTHDDPESDLIGYFDANPTAVLGALRRASAIVIGTGPIAEAAAVACRDSGIETTCVDTAALDTVDLPAACAVACLPITDTDSIAAVEHWCRRRNVPLTLAAVGRSWVWIAPPGVTFMEIRPRLDAADCAAPSGSYEAAAVAAVAAYLSRTLTRFTTSIDRDGSDCRPARIDTETLETTTHRHLPLRLTPRPRDPEFLLQRLATVRSTPVLHDEDFARRVVTIIDDRAGVIGTVSEGSHAQLPLHISESLVTDPAGTSSASIRVFGVGKDTGSARLAAARAALRTYAALAAPREGSVLAYSLDDQAPVTMSVAAACEVGAEGTPSRPPVGVAYGDTLENAVIAGLLDHCRSITIASLSRHDHYQFPEVDAAASVGALGRYGLSALGAMRVPVRLFDLTEVLGAPVVAVLLEGVTVAYGCGVDLAQAVEDGILSATRHQQSIQHNEPDYRPATVPDLPAHLRGPRRKPQRTAAVRQDDLVRTLRVNGYTSAFVLLDDDPHVSAVLPHLVRVIVRNRL
ncbi:YcaO-like family protein [Nocardia sp. NPDC050710]|uniref:YcaO-like family protein n=1 Tax=Nocardia sp. NPDC050710 TaxID=3157220 RepID=UPI0033CE17F5